MTTLASPALVYHCEYDLALAKGRNTYYRVYQRRDGKLIPSWTMTLDCQPACKERVQ